MNFDGSIKLYQNSIWLIRKLRFLSQIFSLKTKYNLHFRVFLFFFFCRVENKTLSSLSWIIKAFSVFHEINRHLRNDKVSFEIMTLCFIPGSPRSVFCQLVLNSENSIFYETFAPHTMLK